MSAPTPSHISYTLIETALGWIGIAWSEKGLICLCLPERDRDATERRLTRSVGLRSGFPSDGAAKAISLPPFIEKLIGDLRRYAVGEPVDFSDLPIDLAGVDDFRRAIYDAARRLSFGEVTTYGELAAAAGHPSLARETGAALGTNPVPIVIPCHRILAAGRKIGGFSAPGGSATKAQLLALEGVRLGPPPSAQASFAF
jgi:methylated-DNA-[protein]-cysteine S-methyltransferase